jgi:hypothetical protein
MNTPADCPSPLKPLTNRFEFDMGAADRRIGAAILMDYTGSA